MTVIATNKDGVNYIEDRVLEINEDKIEGVKKATINGVTYQVHGEWLIDMEVVI